MHRLNCCLLLVALAAGALAVTGCGSATLDTEHVEGVVTIDGQTVPDATVMFTPVTAGEGVSATGRTDANGVYTLTAANTQDAKGVPGAGTFPGEYYVGVIKSVQEEPMSEEEAYEKKVEYVPPAPGADVKVTHVIPQKYNNPKESGIKVTVKKGDNNIPIELTAN